MSLDTSAVQPIEQSGSDEAASAAQNSQSTTPQAVDWSKVPADQIPLNVLKEHPAYKAVLKESIERRHEISALKNTQPATPETPQQGQPSQSQADTVLATLQAMQAQISALTGQAAEVQQNAQINALATKFDLDKEAQDYLRDLPVEKREAAAARFARSGNTAAGSGGESPASNMASRILNNVKGGDEPASPFNQQEQSFKGGGVIKIRP